MHGTTVKKKVFFLQVLVIYSCPALDPVINFFPPVLYVNVYGIVDAGFFLQPFRQHLFS